MMNRSRIAALLTGPYTHLDHLGILALELGLPLFVTEEKSYHLAQKYYPGLTPILKSPEELSLSFLKGNFDLLVHSSRLLTQELQPLFELQNKEMRFLFCPHGNSDKGYTMSQEQHVAQDYALVYGEQMMDLHMRTGALKKIKHTIRSGNYRYPFYKKHRAFYDHLVQQEFLSKLDPKRKTILYAPTWQDGENPTSFFNCCAELVETLPPNFNLTIKLHPLLEEHDVAKTIHLLAKYENYPNVLFISDFPAIYPLLSVADLYLGDFSSIGYDFLLFNKPLFFLGVTEQSSGCLHTCGMTIPPDATIYSFIEKNYEKNQTEYASRRQETYAYAFGEEKILSSILIELERGQNMDIKEIV